MPDWTVLKLWMASCWKVSWNVDPLELSVPLRAALLDELDVAAPLPLVDGGEGEELDEEHAARDSAVAATTAPIVVTCCLRPSCISSTPYWSYMFPRPRQQPQRVSMQTVACEYSLPAPMKLAGKRIVDKRGPEG